MRSGSWAATSRQLILAWAWAGMIVLLPSPVNPAQMPLTSSVGRVARRSSVEKPASPTNAGRPRWAWYAASSKGRADDVDLGIHDAPQAERDSRQVALEEPGVADDRDVRAQAFRVGGQPGV